MVVLVKGLADPMETLGLIGAMCKMLNIVLLQEQIGIIVTVFFL